MATGGQSGAWGTVTNLNLEMIGDAFGYATEAITTNADTHATVIANGAADAGRAMVLKYTGALDSACTITISGGDASTFTVSKLWYIHNATSGSQNIIITSGSGANITIANGQTKCVYTDGAGAGGAVIDTFAALSVVDLFVDDDLTVTDDLTVGGDIDLEGSIDVNGTTNLDAVDIDGAVQIDATVNVGVDDTGYDVKFFGDTASAYMQWDASADDLILGGAAGLVVPQDKLTIASTAVTSTAAELNQLDAITRGSILYGNSSGATARLAKGGAATVLTSDGTDISWAAAAEGGTFLPYPKYPSDWASPSSNYTSSGTWSKGGLDGSTTVWIYLVSGGQGGNSGPYSFSGNGGRAVLLCGWADLFDGGTYVVGAGGTGLQGGPNFQSGNLGGASSFTLSSSNGGSVFTTGATENGQTNADFWSGGNVIYCGGAQSDQTNDLMSNVGAYTFLEGDLPTVGGQLYNRWQSQGALTTIAAQYIVFGAGSGGTGYSNGAGVPSISLYAGNGGVRGANGNGVAPGGGGGGSNSSSDTAGNGAAGSVRVYHVS